MPSIYLALIIPVIVTIIFYFKYKNNFTWWEFFVPIISTLIFIVISKLIIDYSSVQFTEYWGSTVVSVYEEEPYNYWQVETCSRSVPCGSDSKGNTKYCTEYYDCSHQEDVGPSWWMITNIGEHVNITEKQHDELVKRFGTNKKIIDSHNNYDSNDRCIGSKGTKFQGKRVGEVSYVYETNWNGDEKTRKAYTSIHNYENRIKASDLTIFNISLVDENDVDSLGLFRYPKYVDGLNYPTILGDNIPNKLQDKFNKLNARFGPSNQLRLWILVFENKPMSIAQYQENYWVKGNKNELVVCIGKKNQEIQWVHAFSWALSADLTAEVQNKVLDLYSYKDSVITNKNKVIPVIDNVKDKVFGDKVNDKLPSPILINNPINTDSIVKIKSKTPVLNNQTWNEYYDFLNKNLHKFKRREFKEFDYLTVEPSKTAVIVVYILSLLISVLANIWNISNDIDD